MVRSRTIGPSDAIPAPEENEPMKRLSAFVVAALLAGAGTSHAQDANPLSKNMKDAWSNIRDLLTKMAEKMPDDNYRFKPTPELQDFGQRMAHVIQFNMRSCATANGEQKPLMFPAAPSKADIMAGMQQANAYCDTVFNALTDADLMKMIPAGRGGQRLKQAVLQGGALEHAQEMYGYMAVYLRLKGIVPPSSDRNER
jgi:hypothetical protein